MSLRMKLVTFKSLYKLMEGMVMVLRGDRQCVVSFLDTSRLLVADLRSPQPLCPFLPAVTTRQSPRNSITLISTKRYALVST